MSSFVRSFTLGLAVGGRSSVAVTVPIAVATRGRSGTVAVLLRSAGRLAVAGEVVGDKLPSAPSRLDRPVFLARLVAGGVGALGLALAERRSAAAVLAAVPVGVAGAYVGSFAGYTWRTWAAKDGPAWAQPDTRAAALEDALVLATSAGLVRSAPREA